MIKHVQLFTDTFYRDVAVKLGEVILQVPFFLPDALFNPASDMPKVFSVAKKVERVGDNEYGLVPVSASVRSNYRKGTSRITDEHVAGIFCEILRVYGYEEFKNQWENYLEDYVHRQVPGSPQNVIKYIRGTSLNFKMLKFLDRDRVVALKIIDRWNTNLKAGSLWCLSPEKYELSKDIKAYTAFREAAKLKNYSASKFLSLGRRWTAKDAYTAMLWCIASGIHPVRLLNFAGYWMTHRDSQPKDFSKQNATTQEYENELYREGASLGFEVAKPQFSAGFFVSFSCLAREVSWFTEKGEHDEPIIREFIEFAKCFDMSEFPMLGGLIWQKLPLSEDSAAYYYNAGLRVVNEATIKEITASAARRVINSRKASRKKDKIPNTGNPLFDAELLNDS